MHSISSMGPPRPKHSRHPKAMPDHGISKCDMSPQTSSFGLGNVNMESSSRTRIHANDHNLKLWDVKDASKLAIKKEEAMSKKSTYGESIILYIRTWILSPNAQGTTIVGSSISSACAANTYHYSKDKLLRYELEGLPHRGIPFLDFIDAVFQEHKVL